MRFLKYIGIGLLLLLLTCAAALAWMMGTEKGFQQSLALAKTFAPGSLNWEQANGKLTGPLQIQGLSYQQADGIEARVDAIDFDWRPRALLGTELAIEQLQVQGVEVRLAESAQQAPASTQSEGLPDIVLPVSISLEDIAINDIAIYPPGQESATVIDVVALSATLEQSDATIEQLQIKAPQGELNLQGSIETANRFPMDLLLDWQADIGQSAPLTGGGTITGSLDQLRIDHRLDGFAQATIGATVNNVLETPAWDASIDARVPDYESLSTLLTAAPSLSVQTSGTPEQYQARANINMDTTETGPAKVDTAVSGSTKSLTLNSLRAQFEQSPAALSASGQITFADLSGDLHGNWESLTWPLQGDAQVSLPAGSFTAIGSPEDFTATVRTAVEGPSIPEGQWNLVLDGTSTALDEFTLYGETLDGSIAALGKASWQDQPNWDIELVTSGINPGTQWSEFPGRIDLHMHSSGQIEDGTPQAALQIQQLSGQLREQPLSGTGDITVNGTELVIDNLDLAHGETQLSATGSVREAFDLDVTLSSADLSSTLPQLSGALSVETAIAGPREEPSVEAQAQASNLAFNDNRVSSLQITLDASADLSEASRLRLEASDISAGGQQISELRLDGSGTDQDHALALVVNSDQGNASVQLNGALQDARWQGALAALQLDDTPAGSWQLREPVTITASETQADISTLCLDNRAGQGELCVKGQRSADASASFDISIASLSSALIGDYLPPGLSLDTELNGTANGTLDKQGALSADAALELTPGSLSIESEGEPIDIRLAATTVNATLRGTQAKVDLNAALPDYGQINANAMVSDFNGAGNLDGNITSNFDDLSLISAFAPQIQEIDGALSSDLSLGGTLQQPQVQGNLALRDFTAEIPETAMLIEQTDLVVTGQADGTLQISGSSRSGEGELELAGNINPQTQALNLRISGENYEVADSAILQAVISPDLDIQMDSTSMQVGGSVTIPRAYINANGGNEGIRTVSASSDVVFVSEEGVEQEAAGSQVEVDVQIVLGDSVEVEAGDFRGRLDGDLRVQQTPELAPRGTGTINVLNGDYVIYGQQLNMERGRILFGGGPVDNPSLDMQVARTVQEYDVVAGARIQGTAQSPRLELYSEPPMPDASILSYILLGQPPGTTGGSYTLGKYLTPDLYVSYGIGLFDAINTFNMRYTLTDRLAVEAASGSGSSADLIYTIER